MATKPVKILSGKPTAEFYEKLIHRKIDQLQRAVMGKLPLSLATVQIGQSSDIEMYSKVLGRIFLKYGIRHVEKKFLTDLDKPERLAADLSRLYNDKDITGVMVFSPIAPPVDPMNVFINMPLDKDVEGRTFLKRNPFGVFSPTAKAVMALLQYHNVEIFGKDAVMLGHSDLVGKPTMALLSDAGATVTVCHKDTPRLAERASQADILVVAVGKPNLVRKSWIKKGAVVVDIGDRKSVV